MALRIVPTVLLLAGSVLLRPAPWAFAESEAMVTPSHAAGARAVAGGTSADCPSPAPPVSVEAGDEAPLPAWGGARFRGEGLTVSRIRSDAGLTRGAFEPEGAGLKLQAPVEFRGASASLAFRVAEATPLRPSAGGSALALSNLAFSSEDATTSGGASRAEQVKIGSGIGAVLGTATGLALTVGKGGRDRFGLEREVVPIATLIAGALVGGAIGLLFH